MRKILRKLDQNLPLLEDEYEQLLLYIDKLRESSPESYLFFCQRYDRQLYEQYSTYLPRFPAGQDQLIEYIIRNPSAREAILALPGSLSSFPVAFHPYLIYAVQNEPYLLQVLDQSVSNSDSSASLPQPRSQQIVYKYEDSNPYKELGLKAHFDRLGRFTFISRLQSYRYLTRNKASQDRIVVVDGQCLGGIYTNKEKSIYYYIFLTEDNPAKANLACQTLNSALYSSEKRG